MRSSEWPRIGARTAFGTPILFLALAIAPLALGAQDGTGTGGSTAAAPGGPLPTDTTLTVTAPPDTWSDPDVEALVTLARQTRRETAEGLELYEARLRERVYFGVTGDLFRRERGIFDQERISRIRWSRDGDHVVRWEGARVDVPIAGLSSRSEATETEGNGLGEFLVNQLSGRNPGATDVRVGADGADVETPPGQDPGAPGEEPEWNPPALPPPLAYDPSSDRLAFGVDWVLNPLADTAVLAYRYASGDTLSLSLPGQDRQVVLAEVLVEPRRSDFRLVTASLWFDVESGALVRAGYRPARPFDLELDGPEGGDLPPGFLRPIRAEIRYVTVDHGLYDLEWWIPRRYSLEGEARVAAFARFPITIEWTLEDVRPNETTDLVPDVVPEGWILREAEVERDDEVRRVTVLVPPAAELTRSPELAVRPPPSATAFSREELEALERRLEALAPGQAIPGARLLRGTAEGLTRYNRVEGFSTGVAAYLPLPARLLLRTEVRYGFADGRPGGELRLLRESAGRSESLAIFRRVESSSEWARPERLSASLAAALWGADHAPFHRSEGLEVLVRREGRPASAGIRFFAERHDAVERNTHTHLSRLWTDHDLPENPSALEGHWIGAAFDLRWEAGTDPRRPRAFGAGAMEAAGGTTTYGRGWVRAGVTVPLFGAWSGALEAGIGGSTGELPDQRRFFPGGASIFRGSHVGQVAAPAFGFGRAELARGMPAVRLVGFVDVLATGTEAADLWRGQPAVAVGGGFSFLDGLLRLDVARNLRGTERWRFHAYFDGLF